MIADPSGDQLGRPSIAVGVAVSCCWLLPLAFIDQMSGRVKLGRGLLVKAIIWLSGDQPGSESLANVLDMFVWAEPSGFIVKIWGRPVRRLLKAIFVPSGDHAGCESPSESVSC